MTYKRQFSITRSKKEGTEISVLFITSGTEELASSRYRVFEMLPHLENHAVHTEVITPAAVNNPVPRFLEKPALASKILMQAPLYDIIYLQKILLPSYYVRLLETLTTCVYDFDDALYAPFPWSDDFENDQESSLKSTLQAVTAVITGSPVLSNYAQEYSANVHCLPTSIPKEPYLQFQLQKESRRKKDHVSIGWIGNPENLWYLSNVEDAISKVLQENENIHLEIITAGNMPLKPFNNRNDVTYQEWSRETELELLANIDIGIRPLVNDEWTRGKGGFTSVVQLMAMGLPVVVTPVGMLSDMISHGENGYLAEDDVDWIRFLTQLIANPDLRESMGKKAFKTLEKEGFWAEQRSEELYRILAKVKEIS